MNEPIARPADGSTADTGVEQMPLRVMTHILGIVGVVLIPVWLTVQWVGTYVGFAVGGDDRSAYHGIIAPIFVAMDVSAIVTALAIWILTAVASRQKRFVGGNIWSALALLGVLYALFIEVTRV